METASIRLTDFSIHLFANLDAIDIRGMSPLIPHSLFSAAVVQFKLWRRTNEMFSKARVDSLKRILSHFNKRWLVAGKLYLFGSWSEEKQYVLTKLCSQVLASPRCTGDRAS